MPSEIESRILIDKDGWFYEEYRLEEDPPHVVRVRQRGPICSGTDFERAVAVAGISRDPVRVNAERFCKGGYRWLELERQPLPDYPHAIAVFGSWWEGGAEQRAQLGWVPDRIAKRVEAEIPNGALRARLYVIYAPTEDRSAGIRFDLLHSKRADNQPKK